MQPVDFTLYVPDGLAQVLHCVALAARPPQVFDCVANTKVMVLADSDALNPGFVPSVVRGMVNWVGWLFHPPTLPELAWLSSQSFLH